MPHLANRATLIYNPYAGFWDWGDVVQRVATFWQERGWDIRLQATDRPGHATTLAREAAGAGHGLVLAAGGDGTLNEVANGLAGTQTVLAPLPVGTTNSFAKELGLPRPNLFQPNWFVEVSQHLVQGRIQQVDLGKCDNGRYWLLWASTGVDGFVVKRVEPRPRWFKRLGAAGYAAKALFFLPSFQGLRATVVVDDQVVEGDFLLVNVSNCRMFAGGELRLNDGALLDDGLFEVWLFRGKRWPTILRYTVEIGFESHRDDPNVQVFRGRYVAVKTEPSTPFHLDGEPVGDTPFACTLLPRALRLLVPDCAPADLFQQPGTPLALSQQVS